MDKVKVAMVKGAAVGGIGASPETTIEMCRDLELVGDLPADLAQTMLFYGVETLAELIAEQGKHVTKLIAQVPKPAMGHLRVPREG